MGHYCLHRHAVLHGASVQVDEPAPTVRQESTVDREESFQAVQLRKESLQAVQVLHVVVVVEVEMVADRCVRGLLGPRPRCRLLIRRENLRFLPRLRTIGNRGGQLPSLHEVSSSCCVLLPSLL